MLRSNRFYLVVLVSSLAFACRAQASRPSLPAPEYERPLVFHWGEYPDAGAPVHEEMRPDASPGETTAVENE